MDRGNRRYMEHPRTSHSPPPISSNKMRGRTNFDLDRRNASLSFNENIYGSECEDSTRASKSVLKTNRPMPTKKTYKELESNYLVAPISDKGKTIKPRYDVSPNLRNRQIPSVRFLDDEVEIPHMTSKFYNERKSRQQLEADDLAERFRQQSAWVSADKSLLSASNQVNRRYEDPDLKIISPDDQLFLDDSEGSNPIVHKDSLALISKRGISLRTNNTGSNRADEESTQDNYLYDNTGLIQKDSFTLNRRKMPSSYPEVDENTYSGKKNRPNVNNLRSSSCRNHDFPSSGSVNCTNTSKRTQRNTRSAKEELMSYSDVFRRRQEYEDEQYDTPVKPHWEASTPYNNPVICKDCKKPIQQNYYDDVPDSEIMDNMYNM